MGTTERRQREKEELRQLILDGAAQVLAEHGYDKLSIRKVAEAIEYSPGTIYLYYRDKDELMLALHRKVFARKVERLAPLMNIEDPVERIMAMGRVYVQNAIEFPDDYYLMFVTRAPMEALACQDEEWHIGQTGFELLVQTIQEGIDKGAFRKEISVHGTALMLWSMVHGLSMLYLSDRIDVVQKMTNDNAAEEMFEQIEAVLKSGL